MEQVLHQSPPLEHTFGLRSLLGARVLSKNGKIIGRVTNMRVDRKQLAVQGLVVMYSPLFKQLYIDKSYFEQMTPESVVLSIDPSALLKGKRVITFDGEVLGKIRQVVRVNSSNRIKYLVGKAMFKKEFSITPSDIKLIGSSIILKAGHHVKQHRSE